MMTQEQLDEIKARAAAATEGPWSNIQTFSGQCYVGQANDDDAPLAYMKQGFDEQSRNAEFIAHARADIPALLAEVTRWQDRARLYHNHLVMLQGEGEGIVQ